jgi:glycosyltransferase involved in cell wall biosynthesis
MPVKYSIIIPTHNRAEILQRCLQCICELENPDEDWEVLVLNNNSTDGTEEIVNSYRERLSNLRYFHATDPGLHVGRNLGCRIAQGNILCYIDDDSFVSKGWLKGIEKAFQNSEVVLAGGPCLPQYEIEPPAWLNNMWNIIEEGRTLGYLSLIDLGDKQRWISPYYVYGCNFSIRKDILDEIGGFHPDGMPKELLRYRGDGETFVSKMLIESGYRAVYSPSAKIHHLVPASRMTTDYFCHRAYIQGISGSFAQKREQYGVENATCKKKASIGRRIYRRIKRVIKAKLNWEHHKNTGEPEEVMQIRRKMQESYEAGYRYHQEEVKKDPKLLEWVLRENYLGENGKLP